jgi:hypothetical protein
MKTQWIFYFKKIIVLLLVLALPLIGSACDITCSVDGPLKASYKAGEVVIITIQVERPHRNCPVDINDTKITVSGMEITSATNWVNVSGKIWERKLKVTITNKKQGKAIIRATRTCTKEGGAGELTLETVAS